MSRLQEAPGLWKDFVPVAFHVDYWDDLGWRDRWGSKTFAQRQRSYARAWGAADVYTPEFVLNGREWGKVSGLRTIPPPAGKAGVLTVTSDDTNRWQVAFVPATPERGKLSVYAALLAGGLSSDVTRGENAGRRLEHDVVVLKLAKGGMLVRESVFRSAFILPLAERSAAGRLALAVWVTGTNSLEPLQATGGWLSGGEMRRGAPHP